MVVSQNGGCYVNFHKLLMKQCQREFENNELLKNKVRQMDAAQNVSSITSVMQLKMPDQL